jgi:hypothetical protein
MLELVVIHRLVNIKMQQHVAILNIIGHEMLELVVIQRLVNVGIRCNFLRVMTRRAVVGCNSLQERTRKSEIGFNSKNIGNLDTPGLREDAESSIKKGMHASCTRTSSSTHTSVSHK